MEPVRLSSEIDTRLIRTLAKMALRILDKGLDEPSSASLSPMSPEHKGTQETSCDSSRAKPQRDGCEDAVTARRSPTGAPLALVSTDDVHPA
jgi:hypothetical protein